MLKSLAEKKIELPVEDETLNGSSQGPTSTDNDLNKNLNTDSPEDQSKNEEDTPTNEEEQSTTEKPDSDIDTVEEGKESQPELVITKKKSEKEIIQSLQFSADEINLIQDMSCVLGSNPRAIKRFVNIYRVIKAHDIFDYNPKTQNQEILADLFFNRASIRSV